MNCPRDGHPLEPREVNGVSVHACPEDGGMYLEAGELDRIAEPTEGDLEFSTVDNDTFDHPYDHGPIRCPRDPDVEMKKVEFNVYTNIILDWCPKCRGFWLDGQELARINEEVRNLNEADRQVPDPPLINLAEFFWNLPFPK